ncbi:MAG: polymerase sigma factor [Paenibacillaceae bacterium]|jgi:RNA polymerase sigma-70 factor (ECF subfamily)|nr:polymerase sigma factor [Paenibacillaceae bacterium]
MKDCGRDLENIKIHITKYSAKIAGNRWDAEDLAQEAMVKVIRALESVPDREITNAYLYRIVLNVWRDQHRGKPLDLLPMGDNHHHPSGIDDQLVTRELLEELAHRLPPRSMVILLLTDVFGFTAKETAQLLASNEGAIQVAAGRARLRMRKLAREAATNQAESMSGSGSVTSTEPVYFDAVVNAFKRKDAKAICDAYFGLQRQGIQIREIAIGQGKLSFLFRDPDGNLFRVIS